MKNRIKECRERAGMARKELAKQAGVSTDAIRKWEVNERKVSVTSVEKLAKALHVNPAYLVGWTNAK